MSAACIAYIQTIAAIVQAIAAFVFLFSVLMQPRNALIERLLRRWEQNPDMPTADELMGTPYSQRQIEFVNERIKASRIWLRWRWRG
jgi:hypothetical protein